MTLAFGIFYYIGKSLGRAMGIETDWKFQLLDGENTLSILLNKGAYWLSIDGRLLIADEDVENAKEELRNWAENNREILVDPRNGNLEEKDYLTIYGFFTIDGVLNVGNSTIPLRGLYKDFDVIREIEAEELIGNFIKRPLITSNFTIKEQSQLITFNVDIKRESIPKFPIYLQIGIIKKVYGPK